MHALLHHPLVLPVYLPTFLLSLCSGMLIPIPQQMAAQIWLD